jgi:predicted small lipoprotein YifL
MSAPTYWIPASAGTTVSMRVIILATVVLCAACGQSGDLYLPERDPRPQQIADPAPEEDDEDRD